MRRWIDLMEAKAVRRLDPAIAKAAQAAKAQEVYNLTLKVAAKLAKTSFDFRSGWDQTWAKLLRDGVAKARKVHEANNQEEADHHAEQGSTFTYGPFDVALVLPDVSGAWWQQMGEAAAHQIVADAKYEYEYYQDGHPKVEQSNEMSALYDQLEMAQTILYRGSDSIEGMTTILNAIASFVDSQDRYTYFDSIGSAQDFIKKSFPAFMTICHYMGAKKGG